MLSGAELLSFIEPWLLSTLLVLLRIGSALAFLPGFGERSVPIRVRAALCYAISLALLPMLPVPDPPRPMLVVLGAQEVIAGLFLVLLFRMMVFTLQIAGTIIGQSISVAQLFAGTASEPQPVVGNLLVAAGLALFALADLHVFFLEAFLRSYDILPVGSFADPAQLAGTLVDRSTAAFRLAFSLSAPFVAAALLYNLALGEINRAMPQLMVAFVGAPALSLMGIVLLLFATPVILAHWLAASAGLVSLP